MWNSLEDIISRLDSKFSEQSSIKNSVMAADGETVHLPSDLWKKSPVLRKHSVSGSSQKMVTAPGSVLAALIRTHEDGTSPEELRESFDLLAAASELEFKYLTAKCLGNLGEIGAIGPSADFPHELSVGTVMRLFKVLLDSPPRTYDVYVEQLSRIARHCANNGDVMTNAMNLLEKSLVKFRTLDLEPIPIDFETRTVPVAIYKRTGELETVIISGTEVIPVNLFGSNVNLGQLPIGHGFLLKYGVNY